MDRNESELPERLPDALLEGLSALNGPVLDVPPEVDDAMRDRISRHFAARRRRRLVLRRLIPAAAAAAVLVLTLPLLWTPERPIAERSVEQELAFDVDGSGRFDILDPFALARALRDGRAVDLRYDINRDGNVDASDVDALEARVVSLQGDGR